jgi:hypothetical protein
MPLVTGAAPKGWRFRSRPIGDQDVIAMDHMDVAITHVRPSNLPLVLSRPSPVTKNIPVSLAEHNQAFVAVPLVPPGGVSELV